MNAVSRCSTKQLTLHALIVFVHAFDAVVLASRWSVLFDSASQMTVPSAPGGLGLLVVLIQIIGSLVGTAAVLCGCFGKPRLVQLGSILLMLACASSAVSFGIYENGTPVWSNLVDSVYRSRMSHIYRCIVCIGTLFVLRDSTTDGRAAEKTPLLFSDSFLTVAAKTMFVACYAFEAYNQYQQFDYMVEYYVMKGLPGISSEICRIVHAAQVSIVLLGVVLIWFGCFRFSNRWISRVGCCLLITGTLTTSYIFWVNMLGKPLWSVRNVVYWRTRVSALLKNAAVIACALMIDDSAWNRRIVDPAKKNK